MEKQLSFIVPAYNAARTLEKCLDSLLEESSLAACEVIIVNDGSSDATEKIAQSYHQRFPQTVFVINKENGGHGSAINRAIPSAQGKFFRVVDADDWLVSENLPRIIALMEKSQADVLICDFHTFDVKTQKYRHYSVTGEYAFQDIGYSQLLSVYSKIARNCSFHGLCYNTAFYQKQKLRLTEKIYYDDNELAIIPMLRASTMTLVPLAFYQYRIGDVNQSVAFPNQVKRIADIETVIKRIVSWKQTTADYSSDIQAYYLAQMAQLAVSYFAVALVKKREKKEGRELAAALYNYLAENEVLLLDKIRKKYRIMLLLNRLHFSAQLYQKLLDSKIYQQFLTKWIGNS